MSNNKENMEMMQFMCQREVEQLQRNLAYYLVDSLRLKNLINSYNESSSSSHLNEFSLCAYDSYMSNLEMVLDMTRKFNIHLQLKPLSKNNAHHEDPRNSFNDIVQWSSSNEKLVAEFESKVSSTTGHETTLPNKGDNGSNGSSMQCIEAMPSKPTTNEVPTKSTANEMPIKSSANDHPIKSSTSEITIQSSQPDKRKVRFQQLKPQLLQRELSQFTRNYEFTAPITYVEDYDKLIFYICPYENGLLTELSRMFHLPQMSEPPTTENEIFGLSFSNDMIVRAVLPSSGNKTKPYKALLIDFGDVVTIRDECVMYQLPIKYQNLPMQAVKCVLVGVNAEQPNDPIDLGSFLRKREYSVCQFRVVRNEDKVLHLLMLEVETNETNSVPKEISMSSKNENGKSSNPFMFSSEDEDDFTYMKTNDLQDAIPKSALPYGDMCSNVFINDCFSKEILKTKETKVVENKVDDSIIFVTATFIVDIETFYAQVEDNPHNPQKPLSWCDEEVPQSQRVIEASQLNDIVLAKYIIDGLWYRAKVVEVRDNNQLIKVFYVDYGNSETVSLDCIAKCLCLSEPYRAVRCRLGDIRSITQDDDIRHQQAIDSLCFSILNQTFQVKVLRRTEQELWVRIVDENFVDIVKSLISKGYVREIGSELNMQTTTLYF